MASRPSTVLMFQLKATRSRQWLSVSNSAAAPAASLRASAEAKAESQLVARSVGVLMRVPALSLIFVLELARKLSMKQPRNSTANHVGLQIKSRNTLSRCRAALHNGCRHPGRRATLR